MSTITRSIRWMIRRDLASVLAIESESFDFAWNEEDFIRALRCRSVIGMVYEIDEQVVGFMIYDLQSNYLEVLNIAVSAQYRRQGVGTAMIEKLIGKLSVQRRNRIQMKVRESNLAAQLWLRENGFECRGILNGFYDDWSSEDAYEFVWRVK